MFETVIVAALRNKTDRFVQLDSSANTYRYTVAVAELQCNWLKVTRSLWPVVEAVQCTQAPDRVSRRL